MAGNFDINNITSKSLCPNLTIFHYFTKKSNLTGLIMKLCQVLFRRNRLPNGHLFRGKDRLVQPVLPKDLRKLRQDFAVEEQNMFYLRFPYLTEVLVM